MGAWRVGCLDRATGVVAMYVLHGGVGGTLWAFCQAGG